MPRTSTPSEGPALRRHWHLWTEVVGMFAQGRQARRRIDPRAYESLHRELIADCRAAAENAGADRRPYYDGLESMVRPWLTVWVLGQADREILSNLYRQCDTIDRELHGGRRGVLGHPGLHRLAAALAVVILGTLTAAALSLYWEPIQNWVEDVCRAIRIAIKQSTIAQQLIAAGIGVSLLAMFWVSFNRRL